MNKQSNVYTVIYASVLVIVVAAVLAITALSLKGKQLENIKTDKMVQILTSVKVSTDATTAQDLYTKIVKSDIIVNSNGEVVAETGGFEVNVAEQVKLPACERKLPVFIAELQDGSTKYIIPIYGAGLWGPLWGYVSVDANGVNIYGAFFDHQGETPGLGAEIATEPYYGQYDNKQLFKDGEFKSIMVEKVGQKPTNGADYVDAITGGTITSKGVEQMMDNSLTPYAKYLQSLQTK